MRTPPPGQLLYSARWLRPLRIIQRVGLSIALLIWLGVAVFLAVVGFVAADSAAFVAVVVVLAVCGLLFGAFLAWEVWRTARMAMNVTTAGIELRGMLRDHWIPWHEVAFVEQSRHWYWRRATSIVTTSGRPVVALVTSYQYLFFRGEPYDSVSRDPRIPLIPTRVAIDAHQRYLRGEFHRGAGTRVDDETNPSDRFTPL